ncbi:MAG: DUF6228 family protein [Syntrophotaleaceae bacterium]
MEIKSAHSNTKLRFFNINGDYFHASLTSPEFAGTVRVWVYTDSLSLADLFVEMANSWAGWSEQKSWASIEGEFSIFCTHDKLGHITINVEMRQEFGSLEPWNIKACLVVDAVQLEKIAKESKMFFNT